MTTSKQAVLGRYARRVLAERGVTASEYLTHVYGSPDAGWHGDRCGCPDDRCRDGYHHDGGDDECRCLPAVLDQMLGEGVWAELAARKS